MNICFIAKSSKYEWDKHRFSLSHNELLDKYTRDNLDIEKILSSHIRQSYARNSLSEELGLTPLSLDDFSNLILKSDDNTWCDGIDLIVVLGGDNSFSLVLQNSFNVPVMTINSDPVTSHGHLSRWVVSGGSDVSTICNAISFQNFDTEMWPRLIVNDKYLAISEVFLGESKRTDMSRHVIDYRGQRYEQKSSGIVVSTGCGSSGWYSSINWSRALPYPIKTVAFSPTSNLARISITEPYGDIASTLSDCDLLPSDELIVRSLNDSCGIVAMDSWKEIPFDSGSIAKIKLGRGAKVIVPKD